MTGFVALLRGEVTGLIAALWGEVAGFVACLPRPAILCVGAGGRRVDILSIRFQKMRRAVAGAVLAVLAVGLTGCLRTTRLVEKTVPPSMYRTTSVEVLQKQISERDSAIHTLNASVLITASQGGGTTGKVTTYTSLKGYIFVRKPGDLRVILQVPLLGSRGLDMVSDGKQFKMLLNSPLTGRKAIVGTNEVTTPSKNGLENLRPSVFFDSLLVPGIAPEVYVSLTEAQRILPPAAKHKPAIEEPDYDMDVMKIQ